MDSARGNTSSTPPPETNVVSQLGGQTAPISSHALRQIPEGITLTGRTVVSQLASPLLQRENQVLTREGNAQASSQHVGEPFVLCPLSSRKNSTKRTSSKHLPRFPLSVAEKTGKTKQHCPDESSVRHAGAVPAPESSSGKLDVSTVERSIDYLHERADEVALHGQQEKDEGRQKEQQSKAQIIEMKFREQRNLRGLQPYEKKKDRPVRLPTVPLLGCKGFQAPPTVQSSTQLMCDFATGGKTAVPGTPAWTEPSVPEARESPENEWLEIELEDADIPLGQEEWEDDIAAASIPKGSAQNAWWLVMNT